MRRALHRGRAAHARQRACIEEGSRYRHRPFNSPSRPLASFNIAINAARASSGVLAGFANATRTGRGPSGVFADISKPYRSMPVMVAEATLVAREKAMQ